MAEQSGLERAREGWIDEKRKRRQADAVAAATEVEPEVEPASDRQELATLTKAPAAAPLPKKEFKERELLPMALQGSPEADEREQEQIDARPEEYSFQGSDLPGENTHWKVAAREALAAQAAQQEASMLASARGLPAFTETYDIYFNDPDAAGDMTLEDAAAAVEAAQAKFRGGLGLQSKELATRELAAAEAILAQIQHRGTTGGAGSTW